MITMEEWISISIGIVGLFIGIVGFLYGAYIRFYDRKNMKKTTLYYPLFLACRGLLEVINNYEKLGDTRSRDLLMSSSNILDEIVFKHGSIIHLESKIDLNGFLFMKKKIDEEFGFLETKSWIFLIERFNSKEFEHIKRCASRLLLKCKKEVNELKDLTE